MTTDRKLEALELASRMISKEVADPKTPMGHFRILRETNVRLFRARVDRIIANSLAKATGAAHGERNTSSPLGSLADGS